MLEYNPITGLFRNVAPCSNNATKDWYAGSDQCGRSYSVWFDGKNQRAHRVAWYLMTGEWPDDTIDHINGNAKDNRWCNLRVVTQQTNNRNILKPRAHNKLGVQGVRPKGNGFIARITVNGRECYLGFFKSIELASKAYQEAKLIYH